MFCVYVTSAHVYDPPYPGAEGGYIAFPPFKDEKELQGKYGALSDLNARSKQHYAQAYRLIAASALLDEHVKSQVAPLLPIHKLARRAAGIIARELPKKSKTGSAKVRRRFLDGITPEGELCFYDTVGTLAEKVYVLQDDYGFGEAILNPIRDAASARGFDIYTCLNPKDPDRMLHLIIPELSLAFVTATTKKPYPCDYWRIIQIGGYIPRDELRAVRGRIRLLMKLSHSLMEDAVLEIRSAHLLHDVMEAHYLPHIDFAGLDAVTRDVIDRLKAISG